VDFSSHVMKNSFYGDSVTVHWNNSGNALLAEVVKEVDQQNYYGKKFLLYFNIPSMLEVSISESFVHAVSWHPEGKEFTVIHGEMPHAKTTIFDQKANKKADINDGNSRNEVFYDATGRILWTGAFGSLGGDMDFWDISKQEIALVGRANAFTSSYHAWCPNNKYFLACICSPRMKVDNGMKILNYYGELMFQQSIPDLYKIEWRPLPSSLYPVEPIIHKKIQDTTTAKYRHPNFSASKTPVGGKPVSSSGPVRYGNDGKVVKPVVGGQMKNQPKTNLHQGNNKPKGAPAQKKKKQPQQSTNTSVIEEIEQPTF